MYVNVLGKSTLLSLRIYRWHSHSDISNEDLMIIGCSLFRRELICIHKAHITHRCGQCTFMLLHMFFRTFLLGRSEYLILLLQFLFWQLSLPSAVLIRPPLPLPWPACSAPNHIFPFSRFHFFICLPSSADPSQPPKLSRHPHELRNEMLIKYSFDRISERKTKGNSPNRNSETIGLGRIRWSRLRCSARICPGLQRLNSFMARWYNTLWRCDLR